MRQCPSGTEDLGPHWDRTVCAMPNDPRICAPLACPQIAGDQRRRLTATFWGSSVGSVDVDLRSELRGAPLRAVPWHPPRLRAWDWRVPMSGCLGAHHSTAVSRGLLRLRRPTLALAGATPTMPAASLVAVPDAGRCPDLVISAGDSVVAVTVAGVADKSRRACPPAEARGLRATFLLVIAFNSTPVALAMRAIGRKIEGVVVSAGAW